MLSNGRCLKTRSGASRGTSARRVSRALSTVCRWLGNCIDMDVMPKATAHEICVAPLEPTLMIAARAGVRSSSTWGDILCVVDLDGTDSSLLQAASEYALRAAARLHLVHVVPEVSEGLLGWSLAHSGRPLSESLARERILDLASRLPSVYSASVYSGSDTRELARAARATSADLVVLDAADPRFRPLLKRLDCPVLAVPAGWRARPAYATQAREPELAVKQQ